MLQIRFHHGVVDNLLYFSDLKCISNPIVYPSHLPTEENAATTITKFDSQVSFLLFELKCGGWSFSIQSINLNILFMVYYTIETML
uniref:Uncharacterized protein n=1 Tax=Rhizophora mucronata TaxID=61149 RepID=A0A2P2QY32_RHIMU